MKGSTLKLLGLLFIAGLMIAAAGCGGGNNNIQSESYRTFTDASGRNVEVPADPQRIVALEFSGYLWALGIQPVGTAPRYFVEPFQAIMSGVEDVGYPGSPEKIAELEPDLIIAPDYLTPEQIEAYSKIAPVVLLKWAETDNMNRLNTLADLLNRKEEAEQWRASYAELVKQTKEQLSPYVKPGETATIFYTWGKTVNVLAPQVISSLFTDIGFEPTDKMKALLADNGSYSGDILSTEVLPEYAADRMFFIAAKEEDKAFVEELKQTVLKNTQAAKKNHIYVLEPNWYSFEPYLLEWQLADAVNILTSE